MLVELLARMQSPVQITFRDFPSSPALAAHIERRATKLESFSGRIVKCHVVVESQPGHGTTIRVEIPFAKVRKNPLKKSGKTSIKCP